MNRTSSPPDRCPSALKGSVMDGRTGSYLEARSGAVIAAHRTEHVRGSGRSRRGDRQSRVVRENPDVAQNSLISPRQRVIHSMPSVAARIASRPPGRHTGTPRVCGPDRAFGNKRAERYCTAHIAGSDPKKTCGLAAQWVFPSHTHRAGVAPGECPPGRGTSPSPSSGRPASPPRGGP